MSTQQLAAGSVAPDFTLRDQDGTPVTLSALRGGKVIVYFYPQAMTPGCTTEACDFRDSLAPFQSEGYTVLGISKDEIAKLAEFRERDHLTFPLLSDVDLAVHQAYGAWGEKSNYGKTYTGTLRSTFAIDEQGVITLALYNVKATGHVQMLRRKLGLAVEG